MGKKLKRAKMTNSAKKKVMKRVLNNAFNPTLSPTPSQSVQPMSESTSLCINYHQTPSKSISHSPSSLGKNERDSVTKKLILKFNQSASISPKQQMPSTPIPEINPFAIPKSTFGKKKKRRLSASRDSMQSNSISPRPAAKIPKSKTNALVNPKDSYSNVAAASTTKAIANVTKNPNISPIRPIVAIETTSSVNVAMEKMNVSPNADTDEKDKEIIQNVKDAMISRRRRRHSLSSNACKDKKKKKQQNFNYLKPTIASARIVKKSIAMTADEPKEITKTK